MNEYFDEPKYSDNDHSQTLNTEITIEWSNDNVINAVVHEVADRIYKDIKPTVEKAVGTILDERVNEAILQVMNRTVQETDRYGEPKGDPATITELLQRDAEKWLTEKVNEYGKRHFASFDKTYMRINYLFGEALYNTSGGRQKPPMQEMVINAIRKQIGDVTEIVNAQVAEAVKAKFAK